MTEKRGTSPVEWLLYAVALACIGWFIWKSRIEGFYSSEALGMYVVGGVGLAAGALGASIGKRRRDAEIAEADRDKGVD